MARCLLLGIVWKGFSSLRWWTQRNFPLCLPRGGRSHTRFGLDLHLYPYLANRSLPFEVCSKGWLPRRTRKSCRVLLSIFSRLPPAPRIWTKPHLASCGTTPLLPRCSLLVFLILRHLHPLSKLPLWGFANPLCPVPPRTFPSTPQWWILPFC